MEAVVVLACIAMEVLEGRSPQEMLHEPERLPLAVIVDIAAQVADALDHAQRFGIVHRDVKPANIVVSAAGPAPEIQNGPEHLFLSACQAPEVPDAKRWHDLSEQALMAELRQVPGFPAEVLEHAELMRLVLPAIRADAAVTETYVYRPAEPLDVPFTVFASERDELVPRPSVDPWRDHTRAAFELHLVDGSPVHSGAGAPDNPGHRREAKRRRGDKMITTTTPVSRPARCARTRAGTWSSTSSLAA
jgi:serine/threonine protein kinase